MGPDLSVELRSLRGPLRHPFRNMPQVCLSAVRSITGVPITMCIDTIRGASLDQLPA